MTQRLRDILYFDLDKAASLISQIEGGLAESRTEGKELATNTRNVRKYDLLKVFRAEFGDVETTKRTLLETRVLHHDLLMRLEDALFSTGFASDVNDLMPTLSLEETHLRSIAAPYLRARGWCAIEDFDRIYEITKHFNKLLTFVQRSGAEQAANREALIERVKDLDLKNKVNTKELGEARAQLKAVDQQIKKELEWSRLPDELFEGIRQWIDTLARHRLNLRVVPFEEYPDLQLIANLKRGCFVDDDLEHLLFGYGAQPNIQLTVFGLITSVPRKDGDPCFSIYADAASADSIKDAGSGKSDRERIETFERAFRALFPAIQGMEVFTSFHHYPRIVLHPIAVYRDLAAPIGNNV